MTDKSEIAVSKFLSGFNCAQAVLYSFCDDLHFDKDTALKLACGFGAGMGRKEEVCGAVSGAIIAIGIKHGRNEQADAAATETTYRKTRELLERFAETQGSFICRSLLGGCDLTTEAGQTHFRQLELKKKICLPCVKAAVKILETIL